MADLPKIAPYIDKLPYDAKTKAALTSAFSDPKPFEAIGGVGGGVSKQVKQAIFNIRGKAEMGEQYDLDDIFKSITTQPPPVGKAKTVPAKTVEIRKSAKPAPATEESAEEEEAPVEPPASVEPPTLASESIPSQPLIQSEGSTLEAPPFGPLDAAMVQPTLDYQSAEALAEVSGLSYKYRSPSSKTKAVAGRTTAPPPRPKAVEGRATDKKEESKSLKKEVKSEDKTEQKKTSAPPATKKGGSYDGKGSNVYQAFELKDPPVNIKEVDSPGLFGGIKNALEKAGHVVSENLNKVGSMIEDVGSKVKSVDLKDYSIGAGLSKKFPNVFLSFPLQNQKERREMGVLNGIIPPPKLTAVQTYDAWQEIGTGLMAKALGMNPSHVKSEFKKVIGAEFLDEVARTSPELFDALNSPAGIGYFAVGLVSNKVKLAKNLYRAMITADLGVIFTEHMKTAVEEPTERNIAKAIKSLAFLVLGTKDLMKVKAAPAGSKRAIVEVEPPTINAEYEVVKGAPKSTRGGSKLAAAATEETPPPAAVKPSPSSTVAPSPAAPDTPAAPVVTEEPAAPAAATPATETPLTPPPAAGQPAAPAPADKTIPATFSTPNGVTVKDITSAPPKDMIPDVDYEPGVDSIFEAEGVGTFVVFPDKSNPKVFNVLKKDGESSVAVEAASPQEAFEKFIDRPAPAIEVEAPVTATGATEAPPGAVTPTSVTQPPPPVEAQPSPTLVAEPPAPAAPAPKPTAPSPAAPPAPTATEAPKPKDVKKEEISGEEVFSEYFYPVWDDSKGEIVNKKISIKFKNSVDRDADRFNDATFNKGQIGQEKAKAEAIIDVISKATGVTDRKKILEILSEYRSAVNSNVREATLLDGESSYAIDAPSLAEFAKEVANPKKYQALSTKFYPYGVYNKGTDEKPSYAIGSMDKNGVVTSKWSDQKAESKSEADYYVSRMAREGTPAAPEPVTKAPPVTPIKPEVKPAEPTESAPPASTKPEATTPPPVNPASPAPTGTEPTKKSPPPDRRLFINRGSNDRVTVFFKDARDKSFFSAVAKYNGLNSNDKLSPADRAGIVENFKTEVLRIAKDLNISEQNARSILLDYHKAVKDIAQKSPKRSESEIIIEPFTIKEFAETLKSKTATSPPGPVLPSTPVAPVPPSEAGPTGAAQPATPGAVAPKGKGTPENTPTTAPPPVDTKQPTAQQAQPSDAQIRNEEEILKFSPIEELSKKKVVLYQDPKSVGTETGVKTTYEGEAWYTNGHILVKGNPPSNWKPELTNKKDLKLAQILPGPNALGVKQVEPIAFEDTEVRDPRKPGKFKHDELVIMSDGGSISGEYYRYVMKTVNPDSWGIEKDYHYVAFKDGNPIAVVMGIIPASKANKPDIEKIKSRLTERSSVARKELWQMSTDELSKRVEGNPYSPRYASVSNRLGDHANIVIDAILGGKPVPRYVAEGLGINFSMLEYRIAESLADTPEVKNNRPEFEKQVKQLVLEYLDTVQQEGPQPGGVVQFVKNRLVKETPPPRTTTTTAPPPSVTDRPTVPGKEASPTAAPPSVQPDAPVAVDAQPVATPEATPDNTSSESPKITTKYIEPKTPQYRKNGYFMALKLRTNREPVLWVNEKTVKAIYSMLGQRNRKNFSLAGLHVTSVDKAMEYVSRTSSRSTNETEYGRIEEFRKQLEEIKLNSRTGGFTIIVVDSKLRKLEVSPGSYEALKSIPRSKTAKKVSSISDLLKAFRHENIHAETSSVIHKIPRSDANKISADPTFNKIKAVLYRKGYTEAIANVYLAINEFTAHFLSGDYDYFVKNGMTPEELATAYTLVRPYILAVDKDSVSRAERYKKPGLNIVESGPAKLSGGEAGNSESSSNAIPGAMLSTAPIPGRSARSKVTPQEADLVKDVVNAKEGRRDIINNAIEATSDRDKNLLEDITESDLKVQDPSVLRKEGEELVEGEEGIREMPTRIPNAKNSPIDDGTRINIVGLGSIAQDKRMLDTVIRKMTVDKSKAGEKIYHGLNEIDFIEGDPIGSSKQIMDRMVANLLWLHDKMPQAQRDRAKLWYDGASKLIDTWSDQYKASPQAVSGVIAVLSPQKDWYQNAEMARKVLEAYKDRGSLKWNPEMDEFFSSKEALVEGEEIEGSDDKGASLEDIIARDERIKKSASKFYQAVNKIRGKDFNQLTSTYEKAVWLRANDEVISDRSYRILLPEGKFGDISIIESGKNKGQRNKMAWQSYAAIEKAVDIMENPSYDNISDKLGTKHKVRNFYNNMLIPNSENGHVTIDTHAVAAALLQPLSANSTEVGHNFGGISSAATGSQGTYGLIAEAYRKAAAERGLLAREMQSITWEAVRGLFEAKFKSKKSNQKAINDIWDKLDSGEETDINKIREEIFEAAGGIKKPSWVDQGLRTAPPPKKK